MIPFCRGETALVPTQSVHDKIAIFLDGNDSRKKALYAPVDQYDEHETYSPQHVGRFY